MKVLTAALQQLFSKGFNGQLFMIWQTEVEKLFFSLQCYLMLSYYGRLALELYTSHTTNQLVRVSTHFYQSPFLQSRLT